MRYVKNLALIMSILLLGNLIYVATQKENYIVAGALAIPFVLICFLMMNFKGKVQSFYLDKDTLAVNQKEKDEPN